MGFASAGCPRLKQATAPIQKITVGITGSATPITPSTNSTAPAAVHSQRGKPAVEGDSKLDCMDELAASARLA